MKTGSLAPLSIPSSLVNSLLSSGLDTHNRTSQGWWPHLLAPLSRAVGIPLERNSQVGRGSLRNGASSSMLSQQARARITLQIHWDKWNSSKAIVRKYEMAKNNLLVILLDRGNLQLLQMWIHSLARTTPLTEHIHHHQPCSVDQLLPLLLCVHCDQALLYTGLCYRLLYLTTLAGWLSFTWEDLSSSLDISDTTWPTNIEYSCFWFVVEKIIPWTLFSFIRVIFSLVSVI